MKQVPARFIPLLATLESVVTLPPGVAQLRVVLFGFSPTDLRTAGSVTFDDIGLYEE
jgi:hypothetical protein